MTNPATVRIRVGDREYDKPWVASCLACASPALLQIDTLLSYGWSYQRVADYTRSMRPAGVRTVPAQVLRQHVAHLAPPHAESRRQLDEDAAARGDDTGRGSSPVSAADLARLALHRAYESLADGGEATVRDAVSVLKLQRELTRDDADRQLAGTIEQWQAAVREVLWIARKHMGPRWPEFVADLRSSDTLRAIMPPAREEVPGDGAQAAD